jgi:hypothetical protein
MLTIENNNKNCDHIGWNVMTIWVVQDVRSDSALVLFTRIFPILFFLYLETELTTVRIPDDRQCNFVSLKSYSKIINLKVQQHWLLTLSVQLNWLYHPFPFLFLFFNIIDTDTSRVKGIIVPKLHCYLPDRLINFKNILIYYRSLFIDAPVT